MAVEGQGAGKAGEYATKEFQPVHGVGPFITMLVKSEVTKQTPEKSLIEPKKRSAAAISHGDADGMASRRRA